MNACFRLMAITGILVAAGATTARLALADQATSPNAQSLPQKKAPKGTEMVPLLAVSRVTSPDRIFIECAAKSAIATMTKSQDEIAAARLSIIQSEAVRAFNTAADAYNSLADIASERRIKIASASSLFEEERSPNPIDGAAAQPADVAYLTSHESALSGTIDMYANEVRDGRDPKVVAFATQMKARLEHDLLLATVALTNISSGDYGDRIQAASDAPDMSTVSDRK